MAENDVDLSVTMRLLMRLGPVTPGLYAPGALAAVPFGIRYVAPAADGRHRGASKATDDARRAAEGGDGRRRAGR